MPHLPAFKKVPAGIPHVAQRPARATASKDHLSGKYRFLRDGAGAEGPPVSETLHSQRVPTTKSCRASTRKLRMWQFFRIELDRIIVLSGRASAPGPKARYVGGSHAEPFLSVHRDKRFRMAEPHTTRHT